MILSYFLNSDIQFGSVESRVYQWLHEEFLSYSASYTN